MAVLQFAMATFTSVDVLGHTIMGTTMHKHLAPHGKRTIYGPGCVTAYIAELQFKSTTSQYPHSSSRCHARWDQWLTSEQS